MKEVQMKCLSTRDELKAHDSFESLWRAAGQSVSMRFPIHDSTNSCRIPIAWIPLKENKYHIPIMVQKRYRYRQFSLFL